MSAVQAEVRNPRAGEDKASLRMIDCDTHHWQPLELWEAYIDPAFREPVVAAYKKVQPTVPGAAAGTARPAAAVEPPKGDAGVPEFVDGRAGGEAYTASRFKIRGGDYPDERIKWMDSEGIYASISYPGTASAALNYLPETDVAAAACRALNRWAGAFCSHAPARLKSCMVLPWYDPEQAVKELDFALEQGLKVAFATPTPPAARRWSDRSYDPLWKALQDNQVVMTFHDFTRLPGTPNNIVRSAYKDVYALMYLCGHTIEPMLTVMDLILGGVFSRFPRLRFGFVEAHVSWLPGWIAMLDSQWRRALSSFKDKSDWGDLDITPTQLFRRQGFVTAFPDDNWVKETLDHLGEESVVICTDYPHPQARSRVLEVFDRHHPDLDPVLRRKVLAGNAAQIFGIA